VGFDGAGLGRSRALYLFAYRGERVADIEGVGFLEAHAGEYAGYNDNWQPDRRELPGGRPLLMRKIARTIASN
jgi:hypothetical protein